MCDSCLDLIGRDGELEQMRAAQNETLVKELDFSAEKGREEMARLREGMAELLDERVGDCVPNIFVSIVKCICPNYQIYLSISTNVFVQMDMLKSFCIKGWVKLKL